MIDLKSIGLRPRRFKSCRCRFFLIKGYGVKESTDDYESSSLGSIPSTSVLGRMAQLAERSLSMREVPSSILGSSSPVTTISGLIEMRIWRSW